jgi:hypothetical protein
MQIGCHLPTQGPVATREALLTFCRKAEEHPLPQTDKGRTLAATPPDRDKTWQGSTREMPRIVLAQFWDNPGLPGARPGALTLATVGIHARVESRVHRSS